MEAHVICLNDSVEAVVIGTAEQAQVKLDELRDDYFQRNRWNFSSNESYRIHCHWYVRTPQLFNFTGG